MSNKDTVIKTISKFTQLSEEKCAKLEICVQSLVKWNNTINLVGKNTLENVWQRHVLDSAQLVKYIPEQAKIITDFGSGAGFPGMILAILTGAEAHLIEANRKKCAFLNEVARIAEISVTVHNARIEDVASWKSDVVTARALSKIDKLLEYIHPFLKKDSLCLLLKGCSVDEELECARKKWAFKEEIYKSDVAKSDGIILKLSQIDLKNG